MLICSCFSSDLLLIYMWFSPGVVLIYAGFSLNWHFYYFSDCAFHFASHVPRFTFTISWRSRPIFHFSQIAKLQLIHCSFSATSALLSLTDNLITPGRFQHLDFVSLNCILKKTNIFKISLVTKWEKWLLVSTLFFTPFWLALLFCLSFIPRHFKACIASACNVTICLSCFPGLIKTQNKNSKKIWSLFLKIKLKYKVIIWNLVYLCCKMYKSI